LCTRLCCSRKSTGALNPDDVNWINADLTPIPIGVVNGSLTCSAVDPRIVHNLSIFLEGDIGGGEEAQIFRNDGLLRSIFVHCGSD
jgi:hypothetical protein